MTDIVEELKRGAEMEEEYDSDGIIRIGYRRSLRYRAADEIERLRGENKNLRLEMRSLLQVTVGRLTDVEIQRDYGMLGWSVVKRCEEILCA